MQQLTQLALAELPVKFMRNFLLKFYSVLILGLSLTSVAYAADCPSVAQQSQTVCQAAPYNGSWTGNCTCDSANPGLCTGSEANEPACTNDSGEWFGSCNNCAVSQNTGTNSTPTPTPTTNPSGTSGVICDTSNGYELTAGGLCVPTSPFSSGVASKKNLSDLVSEVLKILLTLSGIVAVIILVIGGFQYMTARGNAEQAEKGRQTLINAIIGLVIIVLAYTIVNVVTNALTTGNIVGK